jgi:formate dehydrogenase major subunit
MSARLSKLDFFVVQDIFFSDLPFADVVLPASPSLEKEGTFTSTERRIQRLYQVFEPLGKPARLGDHSGRRQPLGAGWNYAILRRFMDEMAPLTPMLARRQLTSGWKATRRCNGRWPRTAAISRCSIPSNFNFPDGKAKLSRSPGASRGAARRRVRSAFEQRPPAGAFPRRQSDVSHRGHPRKDSDTFRRGFAGAGAGARDRERQPGAAYFAHGKCACRRWSPTGCNGEELYMPMNSTTSPVNRLTSSHTDKVTHTPAYKETRCT